MNALPSFPGFTPGNEATNVRAWPRVKHSGLKSDKAKALPLAPALLSVVSFAHHRICIYFLAKVVLYLVVY